MLSFLLPIWMLCILSVNSLQTPKSLSYDHNSFIILTRSASREGYKPVATEALSTDSASINSTFPWPTDQVIKPNITSQGMTVTTLVPIYEICNLPGANTTSCSPSIRTSITTECSTVLTEHFKRYTVSECDEIITFSSQSSYSLATTTISASITPGPHKRNQDSPDTTTYVQSITTYYAVPWQSIAANDPSGIQARICGSNLDGEQTCSDVNEIWVIHTEYVPIYYTKDISISTSVSSSAVLVLGPNSSLTITPGTYTLSTQITYSTLSPINVTSTSTITPTIESSNAEFIQLAASSLEENTTPTTYITSPASTVTRYLRLASTTVFVSDADPTTTSTTTIRKATTITRTTTLASHRTVVQTI